MLTTPHETQALLSGAPSSCPAAPGHLVRVKGLRPPTLPHPQTPSLGEGAGGRRLRSPAGSIASLRSPPIQLWPGFRDSGEGTSQVRARSVPGPQIVGGPATAYALRGLFASRVIGLFADLRQCPASPATAPDSTCDGARHHLRRHPIPPATVLGTTCDDRRYYRPPFSGRAMD